MSTLLIVDDVPANLALLIDAASAAGYRVLLAENGERALKLAGKVRPDLILLDINMPGLGGIETCRRLKQDPATEGIPVIFVTALSDTADKVSGLGVGAVDYVTKPLQPAEVIARVRVHLELRRLQLELQAEVARREEAERSLRHSLDRAVLVADLEGRILFATVRAAQLLARYFSGVETEVLPEVLLDYLRGATEAPPLELATANGHLRVRRFIEAGEAECATLMLDEVATPGGILQRHFDLTPREAEVLFWMAQGKSNPEIAIILANTTGTVKKQVTSILEKLAVETRMTAALKAVELLGQPR